MRKAVFLDYTGTIIQEGGEEMKAVVTRVCRSSSLHDPQAVLRVWWEFVKQCEETYCGAHYCTEDEIVDQALRHFSEQYGLRENLGELHALIQAFWVNAPLFPDVAAFCADCPLPFYVISNNGIAYVERAMERNGDTSYPDVPVIRQLSEALALLR